MEGFYLTVGRSARGVTFAHERDTIQFAYDRFSPRFIPDWTGDYRKHPIYPYYSIDPRSIVYTKDPNEVPSGFLQGCIAE